MTPEAFATATGVSRETLDRLKAYAAILEKWQKAINLVGPSTLPDLWQRHFLDSAQLYTLAPAEARVWVDLGSGAGFPGLVLAILGAPEMHLVESDGRKMAFLSEAARATGTKVHFHRSRIEALKPFPADVVSARALAALDKLVGYARPFCHSGTVMLFPKGVDAEAELTTAAKNWKMAPQRVQSRSDAGGVILKFTGIPEPQPPNPQEMDR